MLSALLSWASNKAALRRPFVLLWRRAWRLQRGTLAKAALIIRDANGRLLALTTSDPFRLPSIDIDARDAITTQVENALHRLLKTSPPPLLIAIDGTPGAKGVTFLYSTTYDGDTLPEGHTWLDPDVAIRCLDSCDSRRLELDASHRRVTR